ncbi:MAG: type II toxin-antitoxin system RelE/ParE family toxin [Planctomycetes bacterium]|nr:type II toxin-antitoxin system RelE/ParE family toxin [Planctomycetota bacterium]
MSVEVRLRRMARAEYEEAVAWYEERRSGLGLRFASEIDATLEAIGERPDRYPETWPGIREALVSNWPYCLYYQVHDDHVMVIAVFHTSRDPAVWQRRA